MGKNQDPGSGINIPDPKHCALVHLREIYANFILPEPALFFFFFTG
jgi:hypothetical protein